MTNLSLKWTAYNPAWLIELANEQYPNDATLQQALSQCTKVMNEVYFVDPTNPNLDNAEWQFSHSISLFDKERGEIILDILKDGKVGAMEFYDEL